MTQEQLRHAIKQAPFQPFRLRMASGRSIEVNHPEFIWHPPGSRTVMVYSVDGEDRELESIDMLLVESLDFTGPATSN